MRHICRFLATHWLMKLFGSSIGKDWLRRPRFGQTQLPEPFILTIYIICGQAELIFYNQLLHHVQTHGDF